jgi:hypothetical protein
VRTRRAHERGGCGLLGETSHRTSDFRSGLQGGRDEPSSVAALGAYVHYLPEGKMCGDGGTVLTGTGWARLSLIHRIGPAICGKDGNGIFGGTLASRTIAEDRSPRAGQEGSEAGSRYGSRLQSILPISLPKKGDFVSGTLPPARAARSARRSDIPLKLLLGPSIGHHQAELSAATTCR